MEAVRRVEGIVAPIDRNDVDTDQIIPKQFLKRVERTGYGAFLFHDWRTTAEGRPRPDFILNQEPWTDAKILVAGSNFGCGSSREHAAWALHDFGFRAVVASSFADIFLENCFQTGIVPVRLSGERVRELLDRAADRPLSATVDVESMRLRAEDRDWPFELPEHRRSALLEGRDGIAETLLAEGDIDAFEATGPAPSWVQRS